MLLAWLVAMVQTTLDGGVAERALRRIRRVLLGGEVEAPRLYRDPGDPYFAAIRAVAEEVVSEWFAVYGAPIMRDALIKRVIEVIKGRRLRGAWPWPIPRYDTVRRRVNELIEPSVVGSPTPAIALEAKILGRRTTVYFPNPLRVRPEKRREVLEVIREWENAKKRRS